MKIRARFYKDDDHKSVRTEVYESTTFFQGVSDADNKKGIGWSVLGVEQVLHGVNDVPASCCCDNQDVRESFIAECG